MIIGISGKAGAGKDTVAKMIQYLTCPYEHSYDDYKLWYFDYYMALNDYPVVTNKTWQIKHWGGKLKDIASILTGIDRTLFDNQEFKKGNLDSNWEYSDYSIDGRERKKPYSIRQFLQLLGTDAIRNNLHRNAWVNALMVDYLPFGNNDTGPIYPNWLIADTRFPNEIDAIRKRNGLVILVQRPELEDTMSHESETALDDYREWDGVIINNGNMEDLFNTVKQLTKNWKL